VVLCADPPDDKKIGLIETSMSPMCPLLRGLDASRGLHVAFGGWDPALGCLCSSRWDCRESAAASISPYFEIVVPIEEDDEYGDEKRYGRC
jgi:hypothetical protein